MEPPQALRMLVDATPAARTLGSDPSELVDVNGTLFFVANDGFVGRHIWRTDGTAAGTARVTQFSSSESSMSGLFSGGGSLYFNTTALSPSGTSALWRVSPGGEARKAHRYQSRGARRAEQHRVSDGGLSGGSSGVATVRRRERRRICSRHRSAERRCTLRTRRTTLFLREQTNEPQSIWVSDGTAAGTCKAFDPVQEFATGSATLYFRRGSEISRTNGSCGNAEVVVAGATRDLRATNRGVFFGTTVQTSPGNDMFPPTFAKLLWFNAVDGC